MRYEDTHTHTHTHPHTIIKNTYHVHQIYRMPEKTTIIIININKHVQIKKNDHCCQENSQDTIKFN